MKKIRAITLLAALTFTLALTPAASALILCMDCQPWEGNARCFGACNGIPVRYCADWFAYGCTGTLLAPPTGLPSEEAFLLSLNASGKTAQTPIEALLAPQVQSCDR